MSIELFVIANFMMNLLVLGAGARAAGTVRWKRVFVAAVVGTVYASAAFACFPQLRGFAAQTLCLLIMTMILFSGRGRKGRWLRGFFRIAVSCAFAGGVMTLLEGIWSSGRPLTMAAGWLIVAVCAFFDGRECRAGRMHGTVVLRIATRMGSAEVEALIDTGNRLCEPLSGLPVLIVGKKSLRGLLDDSCLERTKGRLAPGFRIVRYGALGGSGEMDCFRPESVCVWRNSEWEEVQDLWVAIYPGGIPSGVEALAPPVF